MSKPSKELMSLFNEAVAIGCIVKVRRAKKVVYLIYPPEKHLEIKTVHAGEAAVPALQRWLASYKRSKGIQYTSRVIAPHTWD